MALVDRGRAEGNRTALLTWLLAMGWFALGLGLGCSLPDPVVAEISGPIDTSTAAKRQSQLRRDRGERYTVAHRHLETDFDAYWELGNAFKRSGKLQLRLPVQWQVGDVKAALQVVLDAHPSKPWYQQIDASVLRLFDEALQDNNDRASDDVADTPYRVAVKVRQHSQEWFVEVQTQILDADGGAFGI